MFIKTPNMTVQLNFVNISTIQNFLLKLKVYLDWILF